MGWRTRGANLAVASVCVALQALARESSRRVRAMLPGRDDYVRCASPTGQRIPIAWGTQLGRTHRPEKVPRGQSLALPSSTGVVEAASRSGWSVGGVPTIDSLRAPSCLPNVYQSHPDKPKVLAGSPPGPLFPLSWMVRPGRFELPAFCSAGKRSIQAELRAQRTDAGTRGSGDAAKTPSPDRRGF